MSQSWQIPLSGTLADRWNDEDPGGLSEPTSRRIIDSAPAPSPSSQQLEFPELSYSAPPRRSPSPPNPGKPGHSTRAPQSTRLSQYQSPKTRIPGPTPARGTPGAIGASISRPAIAAQWPLLEIPSEDESKAYNGAATPRTPNRLDRSSHFHQSSSPLDPQGQLPPAAYPFLQQPPNELPGREKSYSGSSNGEISNPTTPRASRASTSSSTLTIPDFPLAMMPLPPRRGSANGPPSSRRANSTYYSQSSNVTPILEENVELPIQRSHASQASNQPIPSSWGSAPQDFYFDDATSEEDFPPKPLGDGGDSRSPTNDDERGLVREASVGKRHKPSLTTIRNLDGAASKSSSAKSKSSSEDVSDGSKKSDKISSSKAQKLAAATAVGASLGVDASLGGRKSPHSERSLSVKTPSPNSFKRSLATNNVSTNQRSLSPPGTESNPSLHPSLAISAMRMNGEMPGAASVSSVSPASSDFGIPKRGLSHKLPDDRRPPRLEINTMGDVQPRGSITSLPELIRRATRLASVLDRGRPSSRLGLEPNQLTARGLDSNLAVGRPGSISEMLNSFPSPGLASPSLGQESGRTPSPFSAARPGKVRYDEDIHEISTDSKARRCCGLPLWLFSVLVIVGLLIAAASIVLPIVLIILPRQRQASSAAVEQCQLDLPCQNGGTNAFNANFCRCICVNGYTGDRCSQAPASGCAIMDDANFKNVTVGSAIPPLVTESTGTFNIPLSTEILLSVFLFNNLTCNEQNALVTFNGRTGSYSSKSPSSTLSVTTSTARSLAARATVAGGASSSTAAGSSSSTATTAALSSTEPDSSITGGILVAPALTATSATLSSSKSASSSLTSVASPSASSFSSIPTTQELQLDFARICVLLVLTQASDLDKAIYAQGQLQTFFTFNSGLPGNTSVVQTTVNIGSNISADLSKFSITLGNGTVLGMTKPTKSPRSTRYTRLLMG
ncbi:MAG: hypothetical protein M1829_005525 [Trizodia sp. TS-e1964]|nr:MAG: hypothetical protein M1829_005525 [Trizodia sp. TS-e1964]